MVAIEKKTKANNIKINPKKIVLYFLLILLAVVCFIPFYIMIINATHTNGEVASKIWLTPGTALMNNYHRLVQNTNILRGFFNSVFLAVTTTIVSGYFSALTAYGFSRYRFKGGKALYAVVLGTMMIPGQLGLIGLYQLVVKLGMANSYLPLILPAMANASSVFFIKGYTDGAVNESLIEAARIDGCGEFAIFNRIELPLMMPAIATMSIFTFIGTWNSYLVPLIILTDMNKYTLPIMQVVAKGVYTTDYGAIYVCITISVVPIMLDFAFMSKKIVGGLTIGGVKG